VRRELAQSPLQEPLTQGAIVANASAARYLSLSSSAARSPRPRSTAEAYAKDAKVEDAAVKAFYDQNPNAFVTPEQARIEYAILSIDALAGKTTVDAAEARKQYEANVATYTTPEERTARTS
jgi:peptidyl-prolyl cis-trans isomerase D